ncbi:MAG: flavin reductase family protein [Spirochaetaceae bacterium]|jgi:flavin reductase (DIM6/NTAB) family NADH-FMN oxidoreductase RutF|nr:flavin reductase family protein [Spirochaetaceae bacterium]
MNNTLKQIANADFRCNPFTFFSRDWALITVEHAGQVNAMTASWGGLGHIWNKDVAYFFIRPQRWTRHMMDAEAKVSLCFLPDSLRQVLDYMGSASGKDEDKIAKSGLSLLRDNGTPYFAESDTALICRKLYTQDFTEACWNDKELMQTVYPEKDFHAFYVAEVEKVLVKEQLQP